MTTLPLKGILVPTDLSACARAAVTPARRLAEAAGAELVLLYVIPRTRRPPSPELAEVRRGILARQLEALAARVRCEASGVAVRWRIVEGIPARAICRVSEDERTDLIVMATHGRTGLDRWLSGSVAEAVVGLARCPVLVWRPLPAPKAVGGGQREARVPQLDIST